MTDPKKREEPALDKPTHLNALTAPRSVVASCDAVASPTDVAPLDHWRRQVAQRLAELDKLCPLCLAVVADPAGSVCDACRELGAEDTWSPKGAA